MQTAYVINKRFEGFVAEGGYSRKAGERVQPRTAEDVARMQDAAPRFGITLFRAGKAFPAVHAIRNYPFAVFQSLKAMPRLYDHIDQETCSEASARLMVADSPISRVRRPAGTSR